MLTLDKKILNLKRQIKDCKSQLKPSFLCEEDDYQEQLEIRWHIDELEAELDKLLLDNQAEEWIEGWG
jgi:protein-arginine kinase activator protein McsA